MKYGLPRDENPKKKWKAAVENELQSLKKEVCILKVQLDEANHKLTILSSNRTVPDRPHYDSTWEYDSVIKRSLRHDSITCMPSYKNKSCEELRYEDYVLGLPNKVRRYKGSIRRITVGNPLFNFSPTQRSSKLTPEGSNKVPLQPFIPGFVNPDPEPPKLKIPWPSPVPKSCQSPMSTASENVAYNESQTINKSQLEHERSILKPFYVIQKDTDTKNNTDIGTKSFSDASVSTKDETLTTQILLELKKMGEQISLLNDQLSKMDTNISDVSSRVSVMDSRLSAVDMFVTMQRFDKKWLGLETRLANLESPLPLPPNPRLSKDPLNEEKMNSTCFLENETIIKPQNSSFENSGATCIKTVEHETETITGTSDMNLSDFVRSISWPENTSKECLGSMSLYSSSPTNKSSMLSNSLSKTNMENASIEMADLKSFQLSPFESAMVNISEPQENELIISKSVSVSSVSVNCDSCKKERKESASNDEEKTARSLVIMSNETAETSEENSQPQVPELQVKPLNKGRNNGIISNDPLGFFEQKDFSSAKSVDSSTKEIENDDFVIVEKTDIEESVEENLKTKNNSSPPNEASSSSEFKTYNDITEYLEINLGKKKNLVYEFGFEAKPDYSFESEGHEKKLVAPEENKASTPSTDESFQQFKTNFIENKCVDEKQSSPFVIFTPKPQTQPSGKNSFDKTC